MDWDEWVDSNVGMMKKQRCFRADAGYSSLGLGAMSSVWD